MMAKSIVAVLLVCFATCAVAQFPNTGYQGHRREGRITGTEGAEFWRDTSQRMLQNARKLVAPTLTPREREIEGSINYLVTSSQNVNAFAYSDVGQRTVRLNGIVAQFFGWIAMAEAIASETGNPKCFLGYMEYLSKRIHQNTLAMQGKGSSAVTWDPVTAIHQRLLPACTASVDQYQAVVKKEWDYISRMAEASFLLLWLHEVGHHVLRHTDSSNTSLAERRIRESDADDWAIRAMARANQFPSVARPFFYLLSAFQGMSLEDEANSSHPIGARRARQIFSTIRDAVSGNEQLMAVLRRAPGGEQQFFSDIRDMEKQAAAMIPVR